MRDYVSSRLITLQEIMACELLLICPYFHVPLYGYFTLFLCLAGKEHLQTALCPSPTPPLVPLVSDEDKQEDHDGGTQTGQQWQGKEMIEQQPGEGTGKDTVDSPDHASRGKEELPPLLRHAHIAVIASFVVKGGQNKVIFDLRRQLDIVVANPIHAAHAHHILDGRLQDPLKGHQSEKHERGEQHDGKEEEYAAQAGDLPDERQGNQGAGDRAEEENGPTAGIGDRHGSPRLQHELFSGQTLQNLCLKSFASFGSLRSHFRKRFASFD